MEKYIYAQSVFSFSKKIPSSSWIAKLERGVTFSLKKSKFYNFVPKNIFFNSKVTLFEPKLSHHFVDLTEKILGKNRLTLSNNKITNKFSVLLLPNIFLECLSNIY